MCKDARSTVKIYLMKWVKKICPWMGLRDAKLLAESMLNILDALAGP